MPSPWRYTGQCRPAFADIPDRGQESVWDYPRPPRLVPDAREIVVRAGQIEIARTRRALRLLETASPPTFYLPFAVARVDLLVEARGMSSYCEWKGNARYWSLSSGETRLAGVGWSYPSPGPHYELLADYFSVYPGRVACFVDGERVQAQEGGFYGGWVTAEITGPWKGGPGTSAW
jgi:uncharacterized protein (DUF427 family)